MNHTPGDDVARIAAALSTLVRSAARAKDRLAAQDPAGGDLTAHAVLRPLVERGPMRVGTLADALHLTVSSVSRHVDRLLADGLLERRADVADGRACIVAPTDTGLRRYAAAASVRTRWLDHLLEAWDDGDLAVLASLIDRLADAVETDLDHPRTGRAGVHQEIA